jgi:hypothetical protein
MGHIEKIHLASGSTAVKKTKKFDGCALTVPGA